jgi:hypothetical protein
MSKSRIKELDKELGILEASCDADSDKEFRDDYLRCIKEINKELIELGANKYCSDYVDNNS